MKLNPDKKIVSAIEDRLRITDGQCPCVPAHEWSVDTICPCKKKRENNQCCCKLFVEIKPNT
jgi:ferredoxin-thioredoxin reductase catalytic subunit